MVYVPEWTSEVDNTNFIEHDIIHSISYEMKGITCDRSFVRCMILHSLMVVANRNVLSWHKKQNESIWNEYEKRKEHMKRDLFRMKFELEHEDINLTSSWLGWPQIKNELESFENKKLTEVFIPSLFYFSSIRTIWCPWCVLFPFPLCFGVRVCWEIDCIILPLEVVLTHPRIGWAFHTHTLTHSNSHPSHSFISISLHFVDMSHVCLFPSLSLFVLGVWGDGLFNPWMGTHTIRWSSGLSIHSLSYLTHSDSPSHPFISISLHFVDMSHVW